MEINLKNNIDLSNVKKIHFIGIGGISMSGIAQILLSKGYMVSGSDRSSSTVTQKLESLGAFISYGQCKENITDDIDLVIYTAAIHPDNEEYAEAVKKNIPMMVRGDFLGIIMKHYNNAIGVSGTHGKTTTTSMLGHILLAGNTDPTIMVGGMLPAINGNIRIGNSQTFVTEACEYTNSFLAFNPSMEIILNVKEDHMDFFKDLDDIRLSFRKFVMRLPENGTLIINGDIDDYTYFYQGLSCNVITFGHDSSNNYYAENIIYDEFARPTYDLMYNGKKINTITLSVPGEHNVYNSLAAIAASMALSIPVSSIKKGLLDFNGTDRRFQIKGQFNGVTVIDDYAHHPDEIAATLSTVKKYPHNKVWCIFQPHTFTRTKAFLHDFASSLSVADNIILADIYPARETDNLGISSLTLQDEIKPLNNNCYYFPSFSEISDFLKKSCSQGDIVITMGAGDVVNIGDLLLS